MLKVLAICDISQGDIYFRTIDIQNTFKNGLGE